MLDDRKLSVLRAIVEDYVASHEPVGSKAIVERHNLGVSPATIRNDMAVLEEEGYIVQPHTSAGRVPTDRGYRLFVDQFADVKPLTGAERRAIEAFLAGAVDLDDVVARTVRLLAQLTRQVAVIQYPRLTRSTVRHIEVVTLTPSRLLLVVILDSGRVEQRVVDLAGPVPDDDVSELRVALNGALAGSRITEAPTRLADLTETARPTLRTALAPLAATTLEALVEHGDERVALAGTANLTRVSGDFPQTLSPVLEALEEHVVLLRLFGEVNDPATIQVRIGEENPEVGLRNTSIVSTGYGTAEVLGGLGVLGPTRMDYPGTIRAVSAVARYLGRILAGA